MKTDEEIIQESIRYLNDNKQDFLKRYTNDIYPSDIKSAIFTAGMSGVGKTELAIFLKEQNSNLLHIDTDEIREFFKPVGYDGQNSHLFQKASSRGFSELFTYAIKHNLSLILDSNFASMDVAVKNIERLLKRGYFVNVIYMYNYPEICFEYATRRELVTHRKVPKEVFLRSNINSYQTVLKIKDMFGDKVVLDFVDARSTKTYEDIESKYLRELIGDDFDI